MHHELKNVHEHMLNLGKAALAHANYHACFVSFDGEMWDALSVLQAAHAAEIFIKARIAQEHPLLIFEKIPRSTQTNSDLVSFKDLVKHAKTIQYSELPERLWASTGIKLPNIDEYKSFGELRNTIQHFTVPNEWPLSTIDFIYKVIDPFINTCWGMCAIDHHEDNDRYNNVAEVLISREVLFHVSSDCASEFTQVEHSLLNSSPLYRSEMLKRFDQGLNLFNSKNARNRDE